MVGKKKWSDAELVGISVGITFASAIILAIAVILILSIVAPSAMSRMAEDVGMYRVGAWYSSVQYGRDGEVQNADRAFYLSVRSGQEKDVAAYGEQFFQAERFTVYCRNKSDSSEYGLAESYEQFVYGRVSVARYRVGEKEDALQLSLSAVSNGFDRYNAVSDLVYEVVVAKKDKEFAQQMYTALTQIDTSAWDGASRNNLYGVEGDSTQIGIVGTLDAFLKAV